MSMCLIKNFILHNWEVDIEMSFNSLKCLTSSIKCLYLIKNPILHNWEVDIEMSFNSLKCLTSHSTDPE